VSAAVLSKFKYEYMGDPACTAPFNGSSGSNTACVTTPWKLMVIGAAIAAGAPADAANTAAVHNNLAIGRMTQSPLPLLCGWCAAVGPEN
jgi:hypothetical protein